MPKRIVSLVVGILVLLCGWSSVLAADIKIEVNGKQLATDVGPVLEQSRTLVPLRVILEHLGAKVTYTHETKTIVVVKSNTILTLQVNSCDAFQNAQLITLDVPAQVVDGRTLVPLRFVGQALGAEVRWDNHAKTVIVNTREDLNSESPPEGSIETGSQVEKEIFDLVNETREEHGLKPLIWVDELADVARSHSRDMAENNFFSHNSPTSGSPDDRAKAAGLPGAAENIAAGYPDAQEIFQAWMTSPDHRKNILDPDHRFIGVGYFQKDDSTDSYGGRYCTQNFVKGEIILLQPAQESLVKTAHVSVKGYSTDPNVQLTVYKLMDRETYSDRYTVNLTAQNGRFEGDVSLTQGKGLYALWASEYDARYFTYQ